MRARGRAAAGEGDEQVEVVGVLHRAGAEHGVGVHDGVRLGPHDLLRERRPGRQQVGGAGVRRLDAEGHQGVRHQLRRLADVRADSEVAPAPPVHEDRVRRRGDPHGAAGRRQPLRERQAGRALVEAAVDVPEPDVHELRGTFEPRRLQDDAHRRPRALAVRPGEDALVLLGERDLLVPGGSRLRRHRARRVHDAVGDRDRRGRAHRREVLLGEPRHRDGRPEQLAGDDDAQGQDRLVVPEDQRRRGRPVHEHLDHDAAARARSAPARDREHPAGDALPVERVVDVGDDAGERVDAAHEAQRDVREEHLAGGRAGHEALADEGGRHTPTLPSGVARGKPGRARRAGRDPRP